jgi:tRNA1Val (adenine37-N6)-methyltransferase
MELKINEGERVDDLQIRGYQIIQDPKRFCFGVDAVMLAHYAKVKPHDRCLDLCTGTGIVPILMHAINSEDTPDVKYDAIELQEESVEMAKRSVELNDLTLDVHVILGDVKEAANYYDAASFQVVTVNPPYIEDIKGIKTEYEPKMIARHEIFLKLKDVISAASYCLADKGRFYMIHKPQRLAEIICLMREYKIEPKSLRFIHPYVDKEPVLVLIGGLKGGGQQMRVDAPLILYKEQGVYTDEVSKIYRI